jgi:hypothetical protein
LIQFLIWVPLSRDGSRDRGSVRLVASSTSDPHPCHPSSSSLARPPPHREIFLRPMVPPTARPRPRRQPHCRAAAHRRPHDLLYRRRRLASTNNPKALILSPSPPSGVAAAPLLPRATARTAPGSATIVAPPPRVTASPPTGALPPQPPNSTPLICVSDKLVSDNRGSRAHAMARQSRGRFTVLISWFQHSGRTTFPFIPRVGSC